VDFGVCNDGKSVYQLLTWIDGEDLGAVLPTITETEQYALGVKAGVLQRRLHEIPVTADVESWEEWYGRRVREKLTLFFEHRQKLTELSPIADYLTQNTKLLENRPQTFHHGDFNPTNILLTHSGELAVIDFNYCERNACDPVWEFCTIPYGQEPAAFYYTGVLNGYYDGEPSQTEFSVLAYYFAWEALHGMVDAKALHLGMDEDSQRHMENVLRWFDSFNRVTPTWYVKYSHIQYI
jgi:serine/threonine-protein kinase